jgi:ferredoxin--NADP+ reductase
MYEVINKHVLSATIKRLDIKAPDIVERFKPGQFVMVGLHEESEKIPLSIVDVDRNRGYITVLVREAGATTRQLAQMQIRDQFYSILGPLGRPARIEHFGTVACLASGIGAAKILPIAKALKQKENKVLGVIGARTKSEVLLEPQMRVACEKIIITTEDGSYDRKGTAAGALKQWLDGEAVHLVYAVGSIKMMRTVAEMTRERNIPCRVQISPMMLCCTGLCGSCRVVVDDQTVLACIDGPDMDAHKIDFDNLEQRMKSVEESSVWHNRPSVSNPKKNEPGISKKSLLDILKR